MTSWTTERFRKEFKRLPVSIQRQARACYRLFARNPRHPSLHFKQVHLIRPIYSVRVGIDYRAVGAVEKDTVIWFWIGSHAEYDKLISRL